MGEIDALSTATCTIAVPGGEIGYTWIPGPSAAPAPDDAPVCVVMGFFDGFHRGHRHLVERATEHALGSGMPVVAVTFDVHPRTALGSGTATMLLQSTRQRYERLLGAGVGSVMAFSFTPVLAGLAPEEFVTVLCSEIEVRDVFVGGDFRFGAGRRGDVARLRAEGSRHGFSVSAVEPLHVGERKVSSTRIRSAIAAGDMTEAATLLGRAPELPVDVLAYNSAEQLAMFRIASDVALPPDGSYLGRLRCTPELPVVIDVDRDSGVGRIRHTGRPRIDSMSTVYAAPVTLEFLDDAPAWIGEAGLRLLG